MTTNATQKKPEIPTPWEFQQLAKASLDAANAAYAESTSRDERFAAGDVKIESSFMSITVAFLYLRSVELALKAAILERSLAPAEAIPSHKLGHDIKSLIACATTRSMAAPPPYTLAELGMDSAGKAYLERFSDVYANKWFEYHLGPWDIPDLHQCQQIATPILAAIKRIAKK